MREIDVRLKLTDDAIRMLVSHAVNDILQNHMEKQIDIEIEKMKKDDIIEGEI